MDSFIWFPNHGNNFLYTGGEPSAKSIRRQHLSNNSDSQHSIFQERPSALFKKNSMSMESWRAFFPPTTRWPSIKIDIPLWKWSSTKNSEKRMSGEWSHPLCGTSSGKEPEAKVRFWVITIPANIQNGQFNQPQRWWWFFALVADVPYFWVMLTRELSWRISLLLIRKLSILKIHAQKSKKKSSKKEKLSKSFPRKREKSVEILVKSQIKMLRKILSAALKKSSLKLICLFLKIWGKVCPTELSNKIWKIWKKSKPG